MGWMNLNLNGNEYEYFPPYSEYTDLRDNAEGTYTAYIRFFEFKADSVYPDIVFRIPRVHLTLINADPNECWFLRGDLISSTYATRPLFVGEVSGDHANKFNDSEVYNTLKELLMLSWD